MIPNRPRVPARSRLFSRLLNFRRPSAEKRGPVRWGLTAMEPRLLLAGDVGQAVASASVTAQDVVTTGQELVFVDSRVADVSDLVDLARPGTDVVLLDAVADPITRITEVLASRRGVKAIHLVSHGDSGRLELAGRSVDVKSLRDSAEQLSSWSSALTDDADVLLYGCDVGAGAKGQVFLHTLARLTGADVASSNNRSGHVDHDADWILETTVGGIETPLFADLRSLQAVDMVLPITIRAAGATGEETMQLQIDGETVRTWNNVGGDADARQFETFTYSVSQGVTADKVRVVFTNDLYEPAQGIDRNLRVDSINIDGRVFETEDPSVFSTGVWKAADGIQPGFREDELLAGNGYFQYDEAVMSGGSEITIFAAGNENDEQMELWLGDERVRTWSDIGGDAYGRQFVAYTFTADATVSIDDVRIAFINDLYLNDGETDRNLRIDRVVIDGQNYQTEAAGVYSTGTWEPGGVTPGFKQNETLHADGSFYYGGQPGVPSDPGVVALATSNVTVDESAGTASIEVTRTGGSDGTVTVDYATQNATATAGSDFTAVNGTLTFGDGETSRQIIVPILEDTLVEGAEQFSVTIDNVQGGATLLVPRTATVTVVDNDADLPDYDDFASTAGLQLNGNARQSGNNLELTPATNDQAGSAFFETPITLAGDGSFRTAFSFELAGSSAGADGLTFTIQNDARGTTAIGGSGGALGYDGIRNSVAVEFDTYRNSGWDVNDNHVSILQGSVETTLRTAIPSLDLNSGSRVYSWVDYNGTSDSLAVYLSVTGAKPDLAVLKATVDLETVVGDQAFVGFTAGTGGLLNSHLVRNWNSDQQTPPQNPPTEQGDTVTGIDVVTGVAQPTAIDWLPDGRMLIAQKGGVVRTAVGGDVDAEPFIDISDIVNGTRDRGLLGLAVHPDFDNTPYVYLLFTYDPPEVNGNTGLAGPDGNGNRAGRLIRVTADATNGYKTAVAGSDVILLGENSTWDNFNGFVNSTTDFNEPPAGENPDGTYVRDFIPTDSESHTIGGLAFAPDGSLFVSVGDGASYNRVDVRADRVQDIDSLSGKILRIDPITGQGLADNPFFDGDADANRSKVYQSGLRNPFRIAVDDATGQLYVGDVGWSRWEEINAAGPGANFGWPYYEGGNGSSTVQSQYANTPEGQAFFAQNVPVDAAIYALNHQADGINAIVMGDVYRGSLYGAEYQGDVFFNDLGQGIVRHASINPDGSVADVNTFTIGAGIVVAISEGPDGALYYVDLNDNKIGRWEIV